MKVALASVLTMFLCLVGFSSKKTSKETPKPQGNPFAMCVEAPYSVTDEYLRRYSEKTDCNFQTARNRAQEKASDDARNALGPTCRNEISAAEAEALCKQNGRNVAEVNASVSDSIPRPQGSAINTQLGVRDTTFCVTLRYYQLKTTRGDADCPNLGQLRFARTYIVKARVLARCGVRCSPLEP